MPRFCTTCGTPLEAEDSRFCNKCGAAVAAPRSPAVAAPSARVSGRKGKTIAMVVVLLSVGAFAAWEHVKARPDGMYFGTYLDPGFVLYLGVKNGQATGWARIQDKRFDAEGLDVTFAGPLTKDGCDKEDQLMPLLNPDGCARVAVTSHFGRCSS